MRDVRGNDVLNQVNHDPLRPDYHQAPIGSSNGSHSSSSQPCLTGQQSRGHPLTVFVIGSCFAVYLTCAGKAIATSIRSRSQAGQSDPRTSPRGERPWHLAPGHANGRTSTLRLQAFDPSAASLSATSRPAASIIHRPPRYSFDSANGPSVNSASPPRLSITVAAPGAARPPEKTQ